MLCNLQARPMSSCAWCLSVVCHVRRLTFCQKRINISSEFFSRLSSQTILVFPYHSDGNSPNVGVECRWSRQKSRFWAYTWLYYMILTLLPARCYTAPPDHGCVSRDTSLVVSGGVCWWRELDGEMFMTKFQRYAKDNRTAFWPNCSLCN